MIYISRTAYQAITAATTSGATDCVEYGGSLLAVETTAEDEETGEAVEVAYIVYAVPTGPAADRGPSHIRTDADYQNAALRWAITRYPRLRYVGDWHVHPMYLPRLSATDLRTARQILDDSGRDHLLLLLGTATIAGAVEILAFRAGAASGGVQVEELPLRVVADDDRHLAAALKDEPGAPIPLPIDPALPSAATPVKADYLEYITRELRELEGRLEISAKVLCAEDGTIGAQMMAERREVTIAYPPEYPFGAPRVMVGDLGGDDLTLVPLRYGWSSVHDLGELVELALAMGRGPAPRKSARGRPLVRLTRAVRTVLRTIAYGREVTL